jgi:hypothetical protein
MGLTLTTRMTLAALAVAAAATATTIIWLLVVNPLKLVALATVAGRLLAPIW